jgi:hypothetical protein
MDKAESSAIPRCQTCLYPCRYMSYKYLVLCHATSRRLGNYWKPFLPIFLKNGVTYNNLVALVRERTIPSDRRLSAKLVPTFVDRGCHVVSVTDPYGRNLDFLGQSRYYFFQVAPQLYSRGWADPVPDPLLLRKSDSAGNGTRTSESVARNPDH